MIRCRGRGLSKLVLVSRASKVACGAAVPVLIIPSQLSRRAQGETTEPASSTASA